MANSVTKEEVKAFVRDVRIAMDARYLAWFAQNPTVNNVKTDLDTLEDKVNGISTDNFVEKVDGKGLSSNDFTDQDKALLEQLGRETNSAFDAQDVLDIFD